MLFSHFPAETAARYLQQQLDTVRAIKHDYKPIIDTTQGGGKVLSVQMDRLWSRGMLADKPQAYYSVAEAGKGEFGHFSKAHEKFGFNPVPANFLYRVASRQTALQHDVRHAVFAGVTPPFTEAGEAREAYLAKAPLIISLPGDMEAYEDTAWLLHEKIQGRLHDLPLVIENSRKSYEAEDGYWGPLLASAFGLETLTTDLLRTEAYAEPLAEMGIFITPYWDLTRSTAEQLAEMCVPEDAVLPPPEKVPDGAVIFLATRTQLKMRDTRAIFQRNQLKVDVRLVDDLVDPFVSPDEVSGTYEGNTFEKLQASAKAWASMPEHARRDQLAYLGLRADQVYIMAEDSGFFLLEKGLREEKDFRNIEHLRGKTFPGVDTGPILHAMHGAGNFFERLGQIRARKEAEARAAGNTEYVFNDKAYSQSTFGVARLVDIEKNIADAEAAGNELISSNVLRPDQVYMVRGGKRARFLTKPQPDDGAGAEIDNFLVPIGHGFDGIQTEAELGFEYETTLKARARALLALAAQLGIESDRVISEPRGFSEHFKVGFVTDTHQYPARTLAHLLAARGEEDGFSVLALPELAEHADDIADDVLRGAQNPYVHKIDYANGPQAAFLSKADAIIFAPDPTRATDDYWENLFTFMSFIVGEQIADRYKLDKPLYLVNPNGAFDWLEELVLQLHSLGTIPEKPVRLYTSLSSLDQIEKEVLPYLRDYRKEYRPHRPSFYATQPEANPIQGRELDSTFNVGVFCSASTENRRYLDEAQIMAESLMRNGIGMVHGAGSKSMMGVIAGVVAAYGGQQAASTSPPMLDREGNATSLMASGGGKYQFLLARDIYERMEFMINKSDAFAIMVGGAGTVQEFSLLGLLKRRAQDAADPYARKLMEHKHIVIVNTGIPRQQGGFYDALINSVPHVELEELGVHVVQSPKEAMKLFLRFRDEKRARQASAAIIENLPLLSFERAIHSVI